MIKQKIAQLKELEIKKEIYEVQESQEIQAI